MSEMFGPDTLELDKMFRTYGLHRAARDMTNFLSPDVKRKI